ncbi:MAG: hypothetical protein GY760_28460 [Deltaproteobacteria bacterium]|nr:hypothetical protein [Deltaproteobacteria bacterium]
MFGFDLFGKAVKSVFDGVNSVVQTFTGSKKERDKYSHQEYVNTHKSFSSEFHNRNNKNLWDSFWDGLNRMPRSLFVVLIVAYFILSYINPEEFQVLNIGLSTIPEKMWYVLSAIIGFYFCARELHKIRKNKGMSIDPVEFNKMQEQIYLLRKQKQDEKDLKEFRNDSDDFINNIDNPSIDEWINKKEETNS